MEANNQIPSFPASRPLDLLDKPLLDGIFLTLQPRISELTFAGLYLFRKAHDYKLTMLGDSLVILGKGYDGDQRFLPPLTGDIPKALKSLFAAGLYLYGADEKFTHSYLNSESIILTEERDSFDYLYLKSDMAELPGNRYHKKKNRVNYFMARHNHSVDFFGEKYLSGCLELLEEWEKFRGNVESRSSILESEATAESIVLASQLGLQGVVLLVDARVKAFAIGERLNYTTVVCHFEKSDIFMEGISQLVNREFNRLLFNDCTYVNREQDLGEPGLRSAKLSYHPMELVKKFSARLINP